jgi:hypothetical protein
MDAQHQALVSLEKELQARHYRFTTITPRQPQTSQ